MGARTDRKRPPAGSSRSHGHDNSFPTGRSCGVKADRCGSRTIHGLNALDFSPSAEAPTTTYLPSRRPAVHWTGCIYLCSPDQHKSTAQDRWDDLFLPGSSRSTRLFFLQPRSVLWRIAFSFASSRCEISFFYGVSDRQASVMPLFSLFFFISRP